MPAFFEAEFWNLANPEFWVGIGFLVFLAILWKAGAFKIVAGALDAKANSWIAAVASFAPVGSAPWAVTSNTGPRISGIAASPRR